MLSEADNKLLTDTDPGTPMGDLFRRFWLPVALSDDLPGPDCVPLRLRVMGEDLIAFRDSDGRAGLVDAFCPHRGAPLFFGRNEENGLRCVYHGWKFDVSGACVDIPNTPEGESYRHKVRMTAYPCVEGGGMVWAYMGPVDRQPPMPAFDWLDLPPANVYVARFVLQCNYLQSLEGEIDPTHAAFLHMNRTEELNSQRLGQGELNMNATIGGRGALDPSTWGTLEDNEAGVLCLTASQRSDGSYFASAGPLWMLPVFCTGAVPGTALHSVAIRVPIDNHSMMFYRLRWSYEPIPQQDLHEYRTGGYYYPAMQPGSALPAENISNDYQIDRLAQKTHSFTGIKSFPAQDAAMVENQRGPLMDRRREHLVAADGHIIHLRRRLMQTAVALQNGIEPSEPQYPESYGARYATAVRPTREAALDAARHASTKRAVDAEPPLLST